MIALRTLPSRICCPAMLILQFERSGVPPKIPMIGVMTSLTSAWTTLVKAAPITIPTARSTTFPRSRNFLKPPSSWPTPWATFDAGLASLFLGSDDMSWLLNDIRRAGRWISQCANIHARVACNVCAEMLISEAGQLYSFAAADHQQSCHPLLYSGH